MSLWVWVTRHPFYLLRPYLRIYFAFLSTENEFEFLLVSNITNVIITYVEMSTSHMMIFLYFNLYFYVNNVFFSKELLYIIILLLKFYSYSLMNRMLYARKMTSTEKFNLHVSDVNHSPTMDGQGFW